MKHSVPENSFWVHGRGGGNSELARGISEQAWPHITTLLVLLLCRHLMFYGGANQTRSRCLHLLSEWGLNYDVIEVMHFQSQPVRTHQQLWWTGPGGKWEDTEAKKDPAWSLCVTRVEWKAGLRKPQQRGKNRLTLSDSFSSWIGPISPLLAIWLCINSLDTRLNSLK